MTKESISILGCGWLGLPLSISLINKGYQVYGSSTSEEKYNKLKAKNITPYIIDISKRDHDFSKFLSTNILIISITSKSIEDFKNLICQIEKSKVKKVIFISSTSVYPNTNGTVTEETPVKKSALSDIENLFKINTSYQSTIIRFGGLFGYDRKPANFFKLGKEINNPEGFINMIHRDDCIRIIEHIIKGNIWDTILNACTDNHPTRRAFYTKEMSLLGKDKPRFNENSLNEYKLVSSEKLKTLLSYKFKYPDLMNYQQYVTS